MAYGLIDRAARAVPIVLLSAKEFPSWQKQQSARVRNWLRAHNFKPESGNFITLPDAGGGIGSVLALTGEPFVGWEIGDLPCKLPPGVYRIQSAMSETASLLAAVCWALGSYGFDRYKKSPAGRRNLFGQKRASHAGGEGIAAAVYRGRDMITTPASDLGPAELAAAVRAIAKKYRAHCAETVGDQLLKKNYPLIHAVGRASSRAPRLIDLRWGRAGDPLVVVIGKGVVFDTGGLDIKPSDNMLMMKKDMGGAACALGVADLVMGGRLPIRLRLLIPAVENAVSGNAYRPSDVIVSRKGLKVEIGNTDAEGRLILADALAEADHEKPALIVDFATLTGAARVALGTDLPALFSNDDRLADDILAAGRAVSDPLWRLPLWQPYGKMLQSPIADLNSAPSGPGGAITAALFLERFVGKKTPWAHIDLMAWNRTSRPGRPEGGEPQAMRAVYQMLANRYPAR